MNSYLVQMEHVLTQANVVMVKSIAGTPLMKLIVVSPTFKISHSNCIMYAPCNINIAIYLQNLNIYIPAFLHSNIFQLMGVPITSFSVLMESVSLEPSSAIMMMTVETGAMKTLAV